MSESFDVSLFEQIVVGRLPSGDAVPVWVTDYKLAVVMPEPAGPRYAFRMDSDALSVATVFVDSTVHIVPGSVATTYLPRGHASNQFAVTGLTADSVVARTYSIAGELLKQQAWARERDELKTYVAVSSSGGRDLLFIATERRIWEVGTELRHSAAQRLPEGEMKGLVATGGTVTLFTRNPTRRFTGVLSLPASGHPEFRWSASDVVNPINPVSFAKVFGVAGRFWMLRDDGRAYSTGSIGAPAGFLRLPDGDYSNARIYGEGVVRDGFVVILEDGVTHIIRS